MAAKPDWNLINTIEDVLPKFLILSVYAKMKEDGFEFREDIEEIIMRSYVVALPTDPIQKAQVQTKLENFVPSLFRVMDPHVQTSFIAVCSWIIKLVDRHLITDVQSIAASSSLLFVTEAREDGELWIVNWLTADLISEKILTHCRLEGLYLKEKALPFS